MSGKQPVKAVRRHFIFFRERLFRFLYMCVNNCPDPGRVIFILPGRFPDLACPKAAFPSFRIVA